MIKKKESDSQLSGEFSGFSGLARIQIALNTMNKNNQMNNTNLSALAENRDSIQIHFDKGIRKISNEEQLFNPALSKQKLK